LAFAGKPMQRAIGGLDAEFGVKIAVVASDIEAVPNFWRVINKNNVEPFLKGYRGLVGAEAE
jgi:hypothetical protein